MKTNRNLWPLGVIGAFALFFAGMTTVVVIASTHRDHLVADNYYEQELKFQEQIDSASRAKKSGATMVYDTVSGRIAVALPAAQVVEKFSGTLGFYRPSEPNLDREIFVEPKSDGSQVINVSRLATGPWLVRLAWKSGDQNFYLEQKSPSPENKMDYGIAIALGLIGSLHCAAMCGPLQLALPIPLGGAGRIVLGRLIYQLGRVAIYALLGVAGGLVGKSFLLAGFQNGLSIALGVAVLAGFLISKRVALSTPVVRLVGKLKFAMSAQLRRRSFRSLALLGMLNGLLPCGLVYVALAGAVARGNLLAGVGHMVAFGVGTLPMMLAVSLSGKLFPSALRIRLNRLIPYGVILIATLLILRGMSLGIPYFSPNLASSTPGCCVSN